MIECPVFTTGEEMHIGARVRLAREARGFSQRELARRVGIAQATLSLFESGDSSQSAYIVQIADALNVSVDWLAKGTGQMDRLRQPTPHGASFLLEVSKDELRLIMALREADPFRRAAILSHIPPESQTDNIPPALSNGA